MSRRYCDEQLSTLGRKGENFHIIHQDFTLAISRILAFIDMGKQIQYSIMRTKKLQDHACNKLH